jgi:hypothetical protein
MSTPVSRGRWMKREGWKPGPWDAEDDRYEWRHAGFPCLAVRGPMGAWCGYVGVPPGHPWHGQKYDKVELEGDVEVHGGLTYGSGCSELICHEPEPGEPHDVWWLGFDCAHCSDIAPEFHALLTRIGREKSIAILEDEVSFYRTLEYVTEEVNKLAVQAHEATPG